MGILLDEKNKEAWLGELEKEEREEMKASSELKELEGKLQQRIGVLGKMVENFEKLAGQGGPCGKTRQAIAQEGKNELNTLERKLTKCRKEREEKDRRLELLGVLLDYIKNSRYL